MLNPRRHRAWTTDSHVLPSGSLFSRTPTPTPVPSSLHSLPANPLPCCCLPWVSPHVQCPVDGSIQLFPHQRVRSTARHPVSGSASS